MKRTPTVTQISELGSLDSIK